MAIKKQYLKSKPVCKVTFTVPAEEAKKVAVVGDFNNWNPKGSVLKKLKNGTFKGTFDLPKENTYEFRYLWTILTSTILKQIAISGTISPELKMR